MAKEVVLAATISGTRDGKTWPPIGTLVSLPDDEAESMVKGQTAVWPDDERVARLQGSAPLAKEILAGAPQGRDWTEGQHDTNLERAKALALADGDARDIARQAARDTDLDDEHTVPSAIQAANGPVVGDDQPNPTDALAGRIGSTGAPIPEGAVATTDGVAGPVETASTEPETETAADTDRPRPRAPRAKA